MILVCNIGYLDHALFIVHQLRQQTSRNFDIVICSEENFSDTLSNIKGVSFIQIETEMLNDNLPILDRLGKYAYWRIPAIEALSEKYEKILYIDTDIFINTINTRKIFEIDLEDYILAAVRDVHQITNPKRMPRECKRLGKPWFPYFNSGVLLINSQQWRTQNCFFKIKALCSNSAHALVCHDQSLLNLMCDGKWLELSPVWNWQYSYKNCFLTEYVSPNLIHFAGEKKLWHEADGTIPRRYWEVYQDYKNSMLDACMFPSWSQTNLKELSRRMLKNIFYINAHKKYLMQFPTIASTIQHK